MSYREPNLISIKYGGNSLVGMGTFSISGVSADQMDTTAFGSNWKTFAFGIKDGGTISLSGLFDPDDANGQVALMAANIANTDITNLKLYIDNTSYLVPCQTTGYFSPGLTSNQDTIPSWVNVTSYSINADKADIIKIDFSFKISGVMVLV